jgi:uncharacterized membrane protein SpoIIM required for sporulation
MKAAKLIEQRQPSWSRLETICDEFGNRSNNKVSASKVDEFSKLYRAACADLALAESSQLPPDTVDYLHRLVARAHNQLYRSRKYDRAVWYERIFVETPQRIFNDPYVHIATVVFWGLFMLSGWLSRYDGLWPGFAEQVVGETQLQGVNDMYTNFGDRQFSTNSQMFGFYIFNNAGIGLNCFVTMLFVPAGMVTLCYNAMSLGTIFGFMFRPEAGDAGVNFKSFVTAHGPFELTAIVLSAGAGMKIGLSWLASRGVNRMDAIIQNAREALPIAMCAVALFCMAAVIEGLVSPTTEKILTWWAKGMVATGSSLLLMFYLIVLGYPRGDEEDDFNAT